MDQKITIIFNHKKAVLESGQTILSAAKKLGLDIPTLCFHPDLKIKANCRLCLVEIKGREGLFPACSTLIESGMEIISESAQILKARRSNLELLTAEHNFDCIHCVWEENCALKNYAHRFKADINRFEKRKESWREIDFGPAITFYRDKCIDCRNCLEACEAQRVNFLEVRRQNSFYQVLPTRKKKIDCTYCGQCLAHCPVGALEAKDEFKGLERKITGRDKTVVFQFAPSIRASIGEEFGLPPGRIVTGQLVTAIKKLGITYVFDVSLGADFTTVEEAEELLRRWKGGKNLPLLTSCCPAWVKYVQFYHKKLIPNLTTVRSPHIILGGIIKKWFSKTIGLQPKDLGVVSVMPCVSKKYEITRAELKIDGLRPVDKVLTTRELARILRRRGIDFAHLPPTAPDQPLGLASGAGLIYGASGGVAESALRTFYEKICDKTLPKLEFMTLPGLAGVKVARVEIGRRVMKVAVVSGLGNAARVAEIIEKDPEVFDYVEVMACPNGCIGGGGQPLPMNSSIRLSRAKALFEADLLAPVRAAHKNPVLQNIYNDYFTNHSRLKKILHTRY